MGWSWALWWCQKLHERLVISSGLPPQDCLQDRKRVGCSECLHLQYVDNLVVLGTSREKVEESFRNAVSELKSAGLQVYEVELGGEGAQDPGMASQLRWEVGAHHEALLEDPSGYPGVTCPGARHFEAGGEAPWPLLFPGAGAEGKSFSFWASIRLRTAIWWVPD